MTAIANLYSPPLQPLTDNTLRNSPTRVLLCVRRNLPAKATKEVRSNWVRSAILFAIRRQPPAARPSPGKYLRLASFRQSATRARPFPSGAAADVEIGFVPSIGLHAARSRLHPQLASFRKNAPHPLKERHCGMASFRRFGPSTGPTAHATSTGFVSSTALLNGIRRLRPQMGSFRKNARTTNGVRITTIWLGDRSLTGGERGIRTLDRVSPIHAFQACAFNHSAISPTGKSAAKLRITCCGSMAPVRGTSVCCRPHRRCRPAPSLSRNRSREPSGSP